MKLQKRNCMCDHKNYKNRQLHFYGNKQCENTLESTYSPDSLEIVYCKNCYQKETE
ncbi:MAG: hypothetical protein U9O20_00695 [Patescibacteria group bacterium]|nr:hypothetical protein [Patescibacteria group bacterium]